MDTTFIVGGARSGKSRYAQRLCEDTGLSLIYIATGQAFDTEMEDRIQKHRDDRGAMWQTVEEPIHLPVAIQQHSASNTILLIDCLTLWTSNLLFADKDIEAETTHLCEALSRPAGPIVIVSNEVGLGIVPQNELARRFRDEAGRMNQRIAEIADRAYFIVSGLPLRLK